MSSLWVLKYCPSLVQTQRPSIIINDNEKQQILTLKKLWLANETIWLSKHLAIFFFLFGLFIVAAPLWSTPGTNWQRAQHFQLKSQFYAFALCDQLCERRYFFHLKYNKWPEQICLFNVLKTNVKTSPWQFSVFT